ncbi:MAG: GerMN domain-containing protein [Janthinobacterium lividum]
MKRLLICICLTAAVCFTASGCHDQSQPTNPEPGPPPTVTQATPPAANPPSPAKLVVYVINPKATEADDLLMPQTVALRHPDTPAKDALTALLESDHSPIAPGTALRGLSIDNGIATMDFSQSPVKETGGESAQSVALNALAMTLGQFPEINTYQIQVKGRLDKAFGEFTSDGPMDVIRPGDASAAKGTGQ